MISPHSNSNMVDGYATFAKNRDEHANSCEELSYLNDHNYKSKNNAKTSDIVSLDEGEPLSSQYKFEDSNVNAAIQFQCISNNYFMQFLYLKREFDTYKTETDKRLSDLSNAVLQQNETIALLLDAI